jgi:dephospho-CoA kinase
MFHGKPIIGISGGIGSGKSMVADLFGELGCLVIKADQQVRDAYDDAAVKKTLRQWWPDRAIFKADGSVDRKAVAAIVFDNATERERLEQLLHPIVAEARDRLMSAAVNDPAVVAFVWDTPLLLEAGLASQCDTLVFVQAPLAVRLDRVRQIRGWDRAELVRRENLQWPLDRKREISEYVIDNTADAVYARGQVKDVLSRILARWVMPGRGH